jgi:transcriptional regulator with XRE-family HTH domain
MPPRNTSTRRRGFGILLGSLRDSLNETQHEFAERLFVSRSVIANAENGHESPTSRLIAQLIERFPEKQDEIEVAGMRYRKSRSTAQQQSLSVVQQQVMTLLASNEIDEAKDYLKTEGSHTDDPDFLIWAAEQLALIEGLRGNREASRGHLSFAVRLADLNPGFESKLGSLWERLAISYGQDNIRKQANECLNLALEVAPRMASFWHRKGLIQWNDGDLSGAYATLTFALSHKGSRLDVLYARSQVSAEVGLADETIADTTEVLSSLNLDPRKAVCMRCTHAYARFLQHESRYVSTPTAAHSSEAVQKTLSDLDRAVMDMPEAPYAYYFRALCVKRRFDVMTRFAGWEKRRKGSLADDVLEHLVQLCSEMVADLKVALTHDSGHFNQYQRQHIDEIILAFKDVIQV